MQTYPIASVFARGVGVLAAVALFSSMLRAQPAAAGAIEGRVQNAAKGDYLENARVTIEGTALETFTDPTGQYRFSGVPAGTVRVRAFYTGFAAQTATVVVTAGQFAQQDFDLSAFPRPGAPDAGGLVKLDAFVVSTTKEMDGAALALNEKRYAANIVNVVAANEFGDIAEGNVGEFLKFLPGVQIDYAGGDARFVSVGGVGSGFVPITVGGFNIASAASSSNTSRTIELEQLSINNVSRVEVVYSPTPESPGGAMGGSVNLIPRSAFERAKPQFNSNVYYTFRDNDRHFRRSPGPLFRPEPKAFPGLDFSYNSGAITKWFGFTLSGSSSTQSSPQDFMTNTWRGVSAATGGNFPATTPDRPYLSDYVVRDGAKITQRDSLGATLDFRLGRYDTLSAGVQWAYFVADFNNRSLNLNLNAVAAGNFSSAFTHSNAGAASFNLSNGAREKAGTTYTPSLRWRHNGPVWKMDAGLSHSHATNHYRDNDKGYFQNAQVRRTGVTINFDDNWYLRPGRVSIFDTAGNPLDPSRIDTYYINNFNSDTREGLDVKQSATASLARSFVFGEKRIPLTLKTGLNVDRSIRDIRGLTTNYTWLGSDRVATSTPTNPANAANRPGQPSDDGAAQILDTMMFRALPWGFWQQQWADNSKAWTLYTQHPEYFTTDDGGSAQYLSAVNLSKHTEEVVSAAFLRFDTALFKNRVKLTGGYRAELTNIKAEGPLNDPTLNYQKDASGRALRNAAGQILLKVPTSDPLGVTKLTRIDRGTHAQKEYLRFFPSLNTDLALTENLSLRAGLSRTLGRPNFDQYSGGVQLPDTEVAPNPNSAAGRITVNNAGLKPQQSNNLNLSLDYYFGKGVGNISVSGYRRSIRNFQSTLVFASTPEFLALYDIDPDLYGAYPVSTQVNNQTTVRLEGFEAQYKQALTFLPHWARGVQFFGNVTAQRQTGDQRAAFNGNIPRQYRWGVSLSRPKFNVKMNWQYRAKIRRGLMTGASVPPETYNYTSKRMYIDLTTDYYFRKNMALYANFRNLNDATEDFQIYGDVTPLHARFRQREDFGGLWTMGLRSNF